jgi:hypothetical protein
MWCDNCQRPVVGKRTVEANTGGARGALFIGGGSLFGWGDQDYMCPSCGQGVRRMRRKERKQAEQS